MLSIIIIDIEYCLVKETNSDIKHLSYKPNLFLDRDVM